MTDKEAIAHLLNDWHLSMSGKMIVDPDKKDAFTEAITKGVQAIQSKIDHQKCKACKWLGRYGDCTCEDSKYNRFLMKPDDHCDCWE